MAERRSRLRPALPEWRGSAVVVCLLLGAAAELAALIGGPLRPVQAVLAIVTLLLLPGTAAVLGPLAGSTVGRAQQILLVLGISLTVDVLAVLAVGLLPGGVRGSSLIAVVTVVSAGLTTVHPRRTVRAADGGRAVRLNRDTALLALAAVVVAGAVAASAVVATRTQERFTTLSMVDATTPAGPRATLEVQNEEDRLQTYRLDLLRGGVRFAAWPEIRLAAGQRWTAVASIPRSPAGQPVEAMLYRAGSFGAPYRRTLLWLPERAG